MKSDLLRSWWAGTPLVSTLPVRSAVSNCSSGMTLPTSLSKRGNAQWVIECLEVGVGIPTRENRIRGEKHESYCDGFF